VRDQAIHPTLCVLLAFCLLAAPSAYAGEAADQAALDAFTVQNKHCPDVTGGDVTLAAASVAAVSPVWQRISEAYELEQAGYLLYWRGVLAQCLDYQDKAIADLEVFRVEFKGNGEYTEQLRDAKRRLKLLQRKGGKAGALPPPAALSIAFAGAGTTFSVLAISQGAAVMQNDKTFEASFHGQDERTALLEERRLAIGAGNSFLAASIACFSASAVSLAIHLVQQRKGRAGSRAMRPPPSPRLAISAAPLPSRGLAFGLSATW
jgi:hypothetical protein